MSIEVIGQVGAELDQLRALYQERQPKRVLEIGVLYGGTLHEWLVHAAPDATVVAVDIAHLNPNEYESWRKPDTNLVVISGRSQDKTWEIENHAPYDWVFVDGDHSEDAVRHDVELGLRLLAEDGILLIHDITAEGYDETPPRKVFNELVVGNEVWEIVADPDEGYDPTCAHGIGVVQT